MSNGNITQRKMAGAEDANDDIADKSYHHTIQSDAPLSAEQLIATSASSPLPQNGSDMHEILLQRARHKAHLETTLGESNQFFDYKNSSVGSIGSDREIRRELTSRNRRERMKREMRFGRKMQHATRKHENDTQPSDRQRYDATGSHDAASPQTDTHQEFSTQAPEPRATFREPPARGYNPYA